ncbi:MAG TPA: FapA family protein [Bacteroidota bacterium]|nr:FapA family protein [Bacteroidota bacterium]
MDSATTTYAPRIMVAADGLSAAVVLEASAPAPCAADLVRALAASGVTFGVSDDAVAKIASGEGAGTTVTVAAGKAPVPGTDGRIEWCFSPEPGAKALYRNAVPGQRLAVVHEAAPGTPGVSVLGTPLAPRPGKTASLRPGANTAPDAADPRAVVATAAGNIVVADGHIEVQPLLTLGSGLDYTAGKIEFVGSIVVRGDIAGEVTVRAGGSLTVHGNVDDADIDARGDVVVDKGFVGRGKGRIVAGGSVSVLHVLNQSITAAKDVRIGKESVNGIVSAGGRVQAPRAVIAGGTIHADGDVVVGTIGSSDGAGAKVRAGRRGRIVERIAASERELKQAEARMAEVKDTVYRLVRMQLDAGGLDDAKRQALARLQEAQKQLPQQVAALRAEQQSLKEELKINQAVTITVRETVFENTIVEINGCRKMMDAALEGVIFREHAGAIEASADS